MDSWKKDLESVRDKAIEAGYIKEATIIHNALEEIDKLQEELVKHKTEITNLNDKRKKS